MSMNQYGDDLSDVDPSTGARKKHGKNAAHADSKKDNSNVMEEELIKDNDKNRWAVRVAPPQTSEYRKFIKIYG